MKSLISIVIPTYNRARGLDRALRSVLHQTYSHWEVVIVDNHSTDNTDEVVKDFHDSRFKLFKTHNDGVIAASRNLGIQHATGEYVAFLDSDDWWAPEKLKESLRYLKQGADVVYHDLFLATKSNQRFFWRRARTRDLKSPIFDDLIVNGNALNNSSVVASRKVLHEINGFSEDRDLIAAEDYDGWLRAARVTEKFKRIPQTLGYYWAGGENISNPNRMLKNLGAIEERYGNAIHKFSGCYGLCWLNYAKGSAHYRLGSNEMANIFFSLVLFRRATLKFKIKSLYMFLLGSVRIFCSSRMLP